MNRILNEYNVFISASENVFLRKKLLLSKITITLNNYLEYMLMFLYIFVDKLI